MPWCKLYEWSVEKDFACADDEEESLGSCDETCEYWLDEEPKE